MKENKPSAKKFLADKRQKELEKHSLWIEKNLEDIEACLKQQFPEEDFPNEATIIHQHIRMCLTDMLAGKEVSLKLPPMQLGILSYILNNMALWLGNTQKILRLEQNQ